MHKPLFRLRLAQQSSISPSDPHNGWLVDAAIILVGGFACLFLTGYLSIDKNLPAGLRGDHLFILSNAKSYIDGHGFRFNSSLAFPDQQDYAYFPSFDFTQRFLLWLGARFITNPFRLVHALYIISIFAMFGSAFSSFRWLRCARFSSATASLGFVLAPYFTSRAFGHDFLALYYAAPMGAALALGLPMAADDAGLKSFFTKPFVVVALFVAATSGLYYTFFSLMFITFLAVAASLAQRRLFPILAAMICIVASVLMLSIFGYGSSLFAVLSGDYPQPKRFDFEQLMYGLSLAGSIVPFGIINPVKNHAANLAAAFPQFFGNEGVFEWPTLILTSVILCSPLIAASSASTMGGQAHARQKLIFLASICIIFGLLYAARGGLGFLFSAFLSPGIRASGRVMPFLMFFAALILAISIDLAATAQMRWFRNIAPVTIAVLFVAATAPVWMGLYHKQLQYLTSPQAQLEWDGLHKMLAAKDAIDARGVLELPVLHWPEVPPRNGFNGYSHEAPYILDKVHSPTKWSYGATTSQSGFRIQTEIAKDSTKLPARAFSAGFDSVLLQKRAYVPDELALLQTQIEHAIKAGCTIYEDDLFALYSLANNSNGQQCVLN